MFSLWWLQLHVLALRSELVVLLYWTALYSEVFLIFWPPHVCKWGEKKIRNISQYKIIQYNTTFNCDLSAKTYNWIYTFQTKSAKTKHYKLCKGKIDIVQVFQIKWPLSVYVKYIQTFTNALLLNMFFLLPTRSSTTPSRNFTTSPKLSSNSAASISSTVTNGDSSCSPGYTLNNSTTSGNRQDFFLWFIPFTVSCMHRVPSFTSPGHLLYALCGTGLVFFVFPFQLLSHGFGTNT